MGRVYDTARWERLRALQLTNAPVCAYCERMGVTTLATEVDHITPVRQAPSKAFELSNLQSLCKACHAGAKQREERGGEVVGCDTQGIPLKGWA